MFHTIVTNATGITAIMGIIGLIITVSRARVEYANQNALKRFEAYQRLSADWIEDEDFQAILELLGEEAKEKLRKHSIRKKEEFVGYFEELALMLDSRLLNERIAYYMFGYYAILCDQSDDFWFGLDKDKPYWSLFRRFAKAMKKIDDDVKSGHQRIDEWRFHF